MYRSSAQYKDASDVGKVEYGASYRTLINWIRIKQKKINVAHFLKRAGWNKVILVGAGDLCELLIEELADSDIKVECVLEDNLKKYGEKYKKWGIKSFSEVENSFVKGTKVIVTYVDRYNSYINVLLNKNVSVDDVVSIEEMIAYILLDAREQ